MKVNIGPIREQRGGTVNFEGEQELTFSNLKLGLTFTGPAKVKGTVTNTGGGFLVQAEILLQYRAICGRCLDEFTSVKKIAFKEQFLSGAPDPKDEGLVYRFTGESLDLTNCIHEQVILDLPMSFICRSNCLGLCPVCGGNRNQVDCGCAAETVNPQFEKLKDFFPKGGVTNGKSQE